MLAWLDFQLRQIQPHQLPFVALKTLYVRNLEAKGYASYPNGTLAVRLLILVLVLVLVLVFDIY